MTAPAHVLLGAGGLVFCAHCGDSRRLAMPMPLEALVTWTRGYVERHAGCRPMQREQRP